MAINRTSVLPVLLRYDHAAVVVFSFLLSYWLDTPGRAYN